MLDVERISFSIFEWVKNILSGLSASGNKVWNFSVASHAEKNEKKNFYAFFIGLGTSLDLQLLWYIRTLTKHEKLFIVYFLDHMEHEVHSRIEPDIIIIISMCKQNTKR